LRTLIGSVHPAKGGLVRGSPKHVIGSILVQFEDWRDSDVSAAFGHRSLLRWLSFCLWFAWWRDPL